MITIIAINENDEQVKFTAKSLVLVEIERCIGVDEKSIEKLISTLEQDNNELADKLKKLLAEPETNKDDL